MTGVYRSLCDQWGHRMKMTDGVGRDGDNIVKLWACAVCGEVRDNRGRVWVQNSELSAWVLAPGDGGLVPRPT